jgi:hypothetical protein
MAMHKWPMEMGMTVSEVAVSEMPAAAKVSPTAKVPSTTAEAAAAMANFDDQVIGQKFRLRRRCRIDERYGLRPFCGKREQHQPRHGEEAKHSLHQCNPSLDPE